jgi:hypothetical protein
MSGLLYKQPFVSNNAHELNTARYVCAASATVAMREDRLRTELIATNLVYQTTLSLLPSKAVVVGILMSPRG